MAKMKRYTKDDIELIRKLAYEGKSSAEIGKIFGKSAKAIQKTYVRYGIKGLKPGSAPMHLNHFWKGGRIVDKSGYILIKTRTHPFATKNGYVREHRLVMESHLKRFLLPTEVVHHKDGDKQNNLIDNLEVFSSNGEHLKVELSGKCPKWSPEGLIALEKAREKAFEVRGVTTNRN